MCCGGRIWSMANRALCVQGLGEETGSIVSAFSPTSQNGDSRTLALHFILAKGT